MTTISAEPVEPTPRPNGGRPDRAPARRPADPPTVRLGPLLAVCGLVGGAGATTIAYLTALTAARQLTEPVLVADTGGPSGGLAAYAGVEAPRSLIELASDLAVGRPAVGGLYAIDPNGVRVLATGPEFVTRGDTEGLVTLLRDAREAHALNVVDCGTLTRAVDQIVMAAATHVAWVMPATAHGISHGSRVIQAAPASASKELIVARREMRQPKAPLRDLRRIAADRSAPLVLVPHLHGLEGDRLDRVAREAQIALQAILGALRR